MTNERKKSESLENRPWTVRDFGGINWNRDRQILFFFSLVKNVKTSQPKQALGSKTELLQ